MKVPCSRNALSPEQSRIVGHSASIVYYPRDSSSGRFRLIQKVQETLINTVKEREPIKTMLLSQTRQRAIRSPHHGRLGSEAKYMHHTFPSSEAGHWMVYIPVQFPRVLGKNYSLRVLNSRYF